MISMDFYFIFRGNLSEELQQDIPVEYTPFGTLDGVFDGMKRLLFCFAGMAIFPFIVADMLEPREVKQLIQKSCMRMFVYYLLAALPYFAWGDQIAKFPTAIFFP